MSLISWTEGMSSPQRTGTPTSGRISIMVTLTPFSAAERAARLPAGPEPTTNTSVLIFSAITITCHVQ